MNPNPVDLRAVQRAFDRAAPEYDKMAALQQEICSRLLERALELPALDPEVTPWQRIVDLGAGTGQASEALKQAFPSAELVALDLAPAMLQQLRRRSRWRRRLLPVCGDMHRLPLASRSVDLLFSSLAVQWSNNLDQVVAEWRRVLRPGGRLLFTSFGPDTLDELRRSWAAADDGSHVNTFLDMHDVGDALLRGGFRDPVMDVERLTTTYDSVQALLRELKAIGAHNVTCARHGGLTGRARLQAMLEAYESFRQDERYPASWEVIYGAAIAPLDGQPVRHPEGEVATFSVEHLRRRP